MSEQDFKKIMNKIIVGLAIFTIVNLIVVIGGVWKTSYTNSITNKYQNKSINQNELAIKENSDNIEDNKDQIVQVENKINNHLK